MTKEDFIKGWNILAAAYHRNVAPERAETLYKTFFYDRSSGYRFIIACTKLAKECETFPRINQILTFYDELDHREETKTVIPKGCEDCKNGLLLYEQEKNGLKYECVCRCSCPAGQARPEKGYPRWDELFPGPERRPKILSRNIRD